MSRSVIAFLAITVLASSASAASGTGVDPQGLWTREDGAGSVRIAPCGDALCGNVTWIRDVGGPGRIGERVFFDMRRTASGRWSGSAHNPEDGRDYDGTMVLAGNQLITQGCALGGIICKTVRFVRQR